MIPSQFWVEIMIGAQIWCICARFTRTGTFVLIVSSRPERTNQTVTEISRKRSVCGQELGTGASSRLTGVGSSDFKTSTSLYRPAVLNRETSGRLQNLRHGSKKQLEMLGFTCAELFHSLGENNGKN